MYRFRHSVVLALVVAMLLSPGTPSAQTPFVQSPENIQQPKQDTSVDLPTPPPPPDEDPPEDDDDPPNDDDPPRRCLPGCIPENVPSDWHSQCYTAECDENDRCVAKPTTGRVISYDNSAQCVTKPIVCEAGRAVLSTNQSEWKYHPPTTECSPLSDGKPIRSGACEPTPHCDGAGLCVQDGPLPGCCGNGKRDGTEQCDGTDLPPNAPPGAVCLPSCQLSNPEQAQCSYYTVSMKSLRVSDSNAELGLSTTGEALQSSCLMKALRNSMNWWVDYVARPDGNKAWNFNEAAFTAKGSALIKGDSGYKWSDDKVVNGLWNEFLTNSGLKILDDELSKGAKRRRADLSLSDQERKSQYLYTREKIISCNRWATEDPNDAAPSRGKLGGATGRNGEVACLDGWFAVDKDCRLVEKSLLANQKNCGSLDVTYFVSTPISLILNSSADPMSHYTLSTFPLEPSLSSRYWEWRGSNDAPVLVYDPRHTGEIKTAHQVFGNWTFGGKRTASLSSETVHPWKNGFEALAELDSNRDGRVSGRELKPLGLWFDANRDGVSQPGEVKDISQTGVTALFYSGASALGESGDVVVERGYLRSVNGKEVSGQAVDWRSNGHQNVSELVAGKLFSAQDPLGEAKASYNSESRPNQSPTISSFAGVQGHRAVVGAWSVTVDAKGTREIYGSVGEGLLVFEGGDNNTLSGYSMMTLGVNGTEPLQEVVRFSHLQGTLRFRKDNTTNLNFSSTNGEVKLSSTATIEPDMTTMSGTTTVTQPSGKTFTYPWTAHRLAVPNPE